MSTAALLFALLAAVPTPGEEPPEPVQHDVLYWEVGLGTPTGVTGIEWVHRAEPWLEISAGLGIGLAAAASEGSPGLGQMLQWSVMPRLLLGNEHGGVTFGLGASGGDYGDWTSKYLCIDDDACPSPYAVKYWVWANAEIGVEVWTPSGFAVRIFGGWAHGMCTSGACGYAPADDPYLGAGLGYAF